MKVVSRAMLLTIALAAFVATASAEEFVRLKNRWTGDYMHIENGRGYVELTKTLRPGGMWSAQWEMVPVEANYFMLKNRWTGDYMHIENGRGYVELTKTLRPGGMWSAQWQTVGP
jgi:hypothetical protein